MNSPGNLASKIRLHNDMIKHSEKDRNFHNFGTQIFIYYTHYKIIIFTAFKVMTFFLS